MAAAMRMLPILLTLALAACGRNSTAPTPATAPAAAPASQRDEPPNKDFIGRVWIATAAGAPRGSMLIFLPDRSLVMDSCFETYRISQWGVVGDNIRWLEDTIPIEAEVRLPSRNEMTLRIAGQDRDQTYVAASVPYLCPDMPR
jgi:hypothetical protein